MKKTKKILSIILAILMIAITVPFAFAADEIPDFSDAKVITADASGLVYVDGVALEITGYSSNRVILPEGEYKLTSNISTTYLIWIDDEAVLDLNGYTWVLNDYSINLNAPLSVYDTSTDKTGKITSNSNATIWINNEVAVFSLYSGTVENTKSTTGGYAIYASWVGANLYGGKVISYGYAVALNNSPIIDQKLTLGDVVLESGEGYAQIILRLSNYANWTEAVINVTDYTGESLEAYIESSIPDKVKILEGIKSAEDAEKYRINVEPVYSYLFHEKTEYDEATGDINIYVAENTFTRQPSAENNYTVDFSNPFATFQWYEVAEKSIGSYNVDMHSNYLFEYDFKKGDELKISTDSDLKVVFLHVGDRSVIFNEKNKKTEIIQFDADERVTVDVGMADAEKPVELKFSVIKETELEGETGKTLQNPECGKLYWCEATVGTEVYTSDIVVGHIVAHVDAKAKTCTTVGWDAYIYCTACDHTTYNEIPASHEIMNVEAKAPTCTEIGWDAYEYCTVCDYTTYVEKAALDHDIVIDAYVAPKCTETGLTEGQHCSRCDDMTIAQEVIPDLGGHINEDGNTTCDRCDEILLCEDCGRPVHEEEGIPKYICWLITLIKMIVSFFK